MILGKNQTANENRILDRFYWADGRWVRRCDRVSNRVGGRRGDSGKVRNASGPRSLPYAHWKSRTLKSCRLCSRLPFLHQSCSSNNCQNRHTRMPFVPDSPVEMSEVSGICCCDYTFMREGSEEQEEANDTEQECDGEDDEVWPHDSPVEKQRKDAQTLGRSRKSATCYPGRTGSLRTLCHRIPIRRDTPDVFHL